MHVFQCRLISNKLDNDNAHLDKAPRLTIRRVIGILASDTVFVNYSTYTNIDAAMLSMHTFSCPGHLNEMNTMKDTVE